MQFNGYIFNFYTQKLVHIYWWRGGGGGGVELWFGSCELIVVLSLSLSVAHDGTMGGDTNHKTPINVNIEWKISHFIRNKHISWF